MAINQISPGVVPTSFLIGDYGQAPGGSPDALPTLTMVNGKVASSGLEVQSTRGGILFPRVSTSQRNAMNPANGTMLYNNTTNTMDFFASSAWTSISTTVIDSATFILQTANALLPNAQSLGTLTTGLLKNTVTGSTGVLSTAVAGTDYYGPGEPTTIIDTSGAATDNLFVGSLTGNLTLSGQNNTGIGINTLTTLTSGGSNTAMGFQAGVLLTSGSNNTLFGVQAGAALTTSPANCFFGWKCGLLSNSTTGGNAAFGYDAFSEATTASDTSAFGINAGSAQAAYTSCSFFGFDADASVNNLTNASAFGANASVSASNCLVLGNSANVGIGVSNPADKLSVTGNVGINADGLLKLYNAGSTSFSAIKNGASTSSVTWEWPIVDAATGGLPMVSNASGALSFSSVMGSAGNELTTDGILETTQGLVNSVSTYSTGTVTQTGLDVQSAVGAVFTEAMVGGLFVPGGGFEPGIINYVDNSTNIFLTVSQTISSPVSFIIYYGGFQVDNLGNTAVNNLYLMGAATSYSIGTYNPAILSYYETYSATAGWIGPPAGPPSGAVYITRIGIIVTCRIQGVVSTASSSNVAWTWASTIPARFLPVTNTNVMAFPIQVNLAGSGKIGLIRITVSSGTIVAYNDGTQTTSWGTSGTIGISEAGLSWICS